MFFFLGGTAAPDRVEDAEVDIIAQHLVYLAEEPAQCHVTHARRMACLPPVVDVEDDEHVPGKQSLYVTCYV